MKTLSDKFQKEPAVIISAIGTFIVLLIQLIPSFFPQIENEVITSLLDLVQAGVVVATVLFVRGNVYAPATVEKIKQDANTPI